MNFLAINIRKLQIYRFPEIDLETVVLFEWFVLKMHSFKYRPFFYSAKRITNETGIKRRKLESILRVFKDDLGIIKSHVAGNPKVTFYTVRMENIAKPSFIRKFFKDEYLTSVYDKYSHWYKEVVIPSKEKNNSLENFGRQQDFPL